MCFLRRRKKYVKATKQTWTLCNKIADVICETFTKNYYLVKISQSKKDMFISWLEKKEGHCLVKNCLHFITKFMKFPGVYFFRLVVNMILLMNIIFLILK